MRTLTRVAVGLLVMLSCTPAMAEGHHWRFGISLGLPGPWYYPGPYYYPRYAYDPYLYPAPQSAPAPVYVYPPAAPTYVYPQQAPIAAAPGGAYPSPAPGNAGAYPSAQPYAQTQTYAPNQEWTQAGVSARAEQLYVYPRTGQTQEVQHEDRATCQRWAVGQTGYDPQHLPAQYPNYRRAMEACLDARGYSVR